MTSAARIPTLAPTVYILIGPPGSGKSTWRAGHMAKTVRPTVIVSSDDLIDAYAAEHDITYTEAFGQISFKEINAKVNDAFDRALAAGQDVIVDRTNMNEKSRRGFLRRVPAFYRKVAVNFIVPDAELRRRLDDRAAKTGKMIPMHVVESMQASYQAPTTTEFDVIETVRT